MKAAYPIVISKEKDGYFVSIPDFDINTQGESIVDSIEMARDAIGLVGITLEDEGKSLPKAGTADLKKEKEEDIITYVDVDFVEYRKKHDNKAVKKNCSLPYWLCSKAEKEGINFSKVLQDALIQMLE